MQDEAQKKWGPRGAETAGRCELVFFIRAGVQTGRFVLPNDPAFGAPTVLVATAGFAAFTGITPDFIMPRLVMPLAGKVSFRNNPDNPAADDPLFIMDANINTLVCSRARRSRAISC